MFNYSKGFWQQSGRSHRGGTILAVREFWDLKDDKKEGDTQLFHSVVCEMAEPFEKHVNFEPYTAPH